MNVSRAYEKLAFALNYFNVTISEKVCADFGSSKGGFVECLLDNDALKVYSVDTSYGELDWKLRTNPKVIVMERTNAMFVKLGKECDIITIDVSWTKQKNILPNAFANLKKGGTIVSLLKPQYEASKHMLALGKVNNAYVDGVLASVKTDILKVQGISLKGIVESPILGEKGGNKEFLLFITKP